jgi:hypothetical protein
VGSIQSISDLDGQIERRTVFQRLSANAVPERLPSSNSIAKRIRPMAWSIS